MAGISFTAVGKMKKTKQTNKKTHQRRNNTWIILKCTYFCFLFETKILLAKSNSIMVTILSHGGPKGH